MLGWISLAITSIVVIKYSAIDPSKPAQISSMIATSVRTAVPWLFVAFAASSMVRLYPNNITKWIMRNRKIYGLCFAVGMGWQLFFILWYVFGSLDYYMRESYSIHSLVEQLPGYTVLFAMVITSFKGGRKMISASQWRLLHKGGIYLIWGVVFSAYWYELHYYNEIQLIDHVYYWMGITALLTRIAAWGKKRKDNRSKTPLPNLIFAFPLLAIGIYMIIFGGSWSPQMLGVLSNIPLGQWIEHFIAFIPVMPILVAAIILSPPQKIANKSLERN